VFEELVIMREEAIGSPDLPRNLLLLVPISDLSTVVSVCIILSSYSLPSLCSGKYLAIP